eukprot:gb/GEZN01002479.1/.p1 GENE.gb/GEZN01002479.1/~~gb/GEZN01002479.1/.p1  ORF type:complete len:646 (+),score=86.01 gb/GEZN01002479.1/:75-2012(+)
MLSLLIAGGIGSVVAECVTTSGYPCIFPFNYAGMSFSACTTYGDSEPWCAVNTDAEGNFQTGEWSMCDTGCGKVQATGVVIGTACTLPRWSDRFRDPGNCANQIGDICTPTCGLGFTGSPASSISCSATGWSEFQGCKADFEMGVPDHPQCLKDKTCGDDDECTEDYCDKDNACMTLPVSGCLQCTDVSECPAGGDCRTPVCRIDKYGWQVCTYEYTQCWDYDDCTVDYCMDGECKHQKFAPFPGVSPALAAPICTKEPAGSIFQVELQFNATIWPNGASILKKLQQCSGYGGKDVPAKVAIRDFTLWDDGSATCTVMVFQARQENIAKLGEVLVNLIDIGQCDASLVNAVQRYEVKANCIDMDFAGAVYSDHCMDDRAGPSIYSPPAIHSRKANKGLLAFFILFGIFGVAGGIGYYKYAKKYGEEPELLEKGTLDAIPSKEREALTNDEDATDEGGAKHKRIFSYSPGGTRQAYQHARSSSQAVPASMMGGEEMDHSMLRGGMENSRFAGIASGEFDEDDVDPMSGWEARNEAENPPEMVCVALPAYEIEGGPTKINVVCLDGMLISEFILACCRKIDQVSAKSGSPSKRGTLESRAHTLMILNHEGLPFREDSAVGNLHAQFRATKGSTGRDRVQARLVRKQV